MSASGSSSTSAVETDLARDLANVEPEVRRLAVQRLRELPSDQAAPLFPRALGDQDWRVRKEAVLSAIAATPRDPVVLVLVAALGDDRDVGLRNAAVEALVGIGSASVPAVIDALRTLDADGRKLALEALAGIPDPRAIEGLIAALTDEDPNVRSVAAEGLAVSDMAGEPSRSNAVKALLSAARAGEELFVRFAAMSALTKLEAEVPWESLEVLLSDPITRRPALALAAVSETPGAWVALAKALGDASPTVASEALLSLARRLEDDDGEARALADDDVTRTLRAGSVRTRLRNWATNDQMSTRVRCAALVTLGRVRDPNDVALLSAMLADEDLAAHAELGLRLFGEGAVIPMMAASRAAPPGIRGATMSIVSMLAPAHLSSLSLGVEDDLRRALIDRSGDVRASALKTLAQVGTPDDLLRAARMVTDADPQAAAAASAALTFLSTSHLDAARALVASSDPITQEAAAGCIALAAMFRAGDAPTNAHRTFLHRALTHGDALVRAAALDALGMVHDADAIEAASFALADEERDVLLAAIRALGMMKAAAPLSSLLASTMDPALVSPLLLALADADPKAGYQAALVRLSSPDPAVVTAAIRAAARADHEHREGALALVLGHADADVVKAALAELARLGTSSAAAHVRTALDHRGWEVRRFAAELLATMPDGHVHLREHLELERDPVVKAAIANALVGRPTPREG